MSEGEEEHPRIFGIPIPAEVTENLERMRSLHHMEANQVRHQVYDFLRNLDKDSLLVFDKLLIKAAEDSAFAYFMSGYVDGLMESKFQVCPGCGEPLSSHDPESLLPPEEDQSSKSFKDRINNLITPEMREQMNVYGLDDVWDIETEQFLYYQCAQTEKSPYTGCGMHYVSIQDRMLESPGIDGCSGCQLRSGHG